MAITIIDGFTVSGATPIDDRMVVANIAARDAIASFQRFEGLEVRVIDNGGAVQEKFVLDGGITNGDWVSLSGADGNGIYTASGSLSAITEVDLLAFSLNFKSTAIPNILNLLDTGNIGLGTAALPNNHVFLSSGLYSNSFTINNIFGGDFNSTTAITTALSGAGSFLDKKGWNIIMSGGGAGSINTGIKISVLEADENTAIRALNGRSIFGSGSAPIARVDIIGENTTSGTTALLVRNNVGTQMLKITDDGAAIFGAGTATRDFNINGLLRLGNGGVSEIYLNNASSGSQFIIKDENPGFNTFTFQLGTTGSLSNLYTSGPAWSMNKNLRFDTSGSRTNIYVNNGGNGIMINGRNSSAGDIKIDDNGDTGFFRQATAPRPTVTGSRAGNAALASFLTGLASIGLITDSTTA